MALRICAPVTMAGTRAATAGAGGAEVVAAAAAVVVVPIAWEAGVLLLMLLLLLLLLLAAATAGVPIVWAEECAAATPAGVVDTGTCARCVWPYGVGVCGPDVLAAPCVGWCCTG